MLELFAEIYFDVFLHSFFFQKEYFYMYPVRSNLVGLTYTANGEITPTLIFMNPTPPTRNCSPSPI